MPPLKTLIVDDVEGLRRLVSMVLESSDRYEVVGEAGDGKAAIQQVQQAEVDLVLLDLSMPGMDGFEALERILKAAPGVKVIVLSGHEEDYVEEEALEKGALGYVEKGLTPEGLLSDLDELVDEA